MAGSVVYSIKISSTIICDVCLNSVLWQGSDHHPYSLVTEMRNYKDKNLVEVSDDCFKAIAKSEITFKEIRHDLCEAKINMIDFLVKQMEYGWLQYSHMPLYHTQNSKEVFYYEATDI